MLMVDGSSRSHHTLSFNWMARETPDKRNSDVIIPNFRNSSKLPRLPCPQRKLFHSSFSCWTDQHLPTRLLPSLQLDRSLILHTSFRLDEPWPGLKVTATIEPHLSSASNLSRTFSPTSTIIVPSPNCRYLYTPFPQIT